MIHAVLNRLKDLHEHGFNFQEGAEMKKYALLLLLFILIPAAVFSMPGDSSLPFLANNMDPATIAQANALIAGADDINSLLVNPAGLGHLTWQGLKASYNTWFFDLKYNSLMLASPVYFGAVGLSFGYFYTSPLDEIREWNATSSKLKYSDLNIGLSYGSDFALFQGTFTAGFTAKYIYEQLGYIRGDAFLFDLGVQHRFTLFNFDIMEKYSENFGIGLVARNLGTGIKYSDNAWESVPVTLGMGISYKPLRYFRTEIDFETSAETKYRLNIGTEVYFFKNIIPLIGYTLDDQTHYMSVGMGFSYLISKYRFIFHVSSKFNPTFGNNYFAGLTIYRTGLEESSLKTEKIVVIKDKVNTSLKYPQGVKIGILDVANNLISKETEDFIKLFPGLLNNYLKQLGSKDITVVDRNEILDIYKASEIKVDEYHSDKAMKTLSGWMDIDLVIYGYTLTLNNESYIKLEMLDVKSMKVASTDYFSLENIDELDLLEKIGKRIILQIKHLTEK